MQLFYLAATILSLIPSTSKAWIIGPQSQSLAVRPTIPFPSSSSSRRRRRIGTNRIPKLQAIKNSVDSSATSTTTLPKFLSPFNRTNINAADNNNDNNDAFSIKGKGKKLTTHFSSGDSDMENFSSTTSDSNADTTNNNNESLLLATAAVLTVAVGLFAYSSQTTTADGVAALSSNFAALPSTVLTTGSSLVGVAREVFHDPGAALDHVVELTDSMGPLGIAYFGVAYCIAEILAIPAIPLTASAGYLFGPVQGTAIVLLSASIAAAVSFMIGRTLLRDYVEGVLKDYPKFSKLDRAIGREGFKLMLLLRLSPIFPFALSNYLYGATSINFSAFFGGTILGFAPGTIAYVYTGYVGKALTSDAGSDVYPWYVYLGGLTLFAGVLKVVADTATRVVEEIEAEEEEAAAAGTQNDNDVYF